MLASTHFLDDTNIGLLCYDKAGQIIEANEAVARLFGVSTRDLVGSALIDKSVGIIRRDGVPYAFSELLSLVANDSHRQRFDEIVGVDQVGLPRKWFNVRTYPLPGPEPHGVIAAILDVTTQVERTNLLELLASVGRLVTSTPDQDSLLQGLCDLLVDEGGYELAWIGGPSRDDDGTVSIMFSSGRSDYLYPGIVSSFESEPTGQGPTGIATRTRVAQIANNFVTQPEFDPWRSRAKRFGLSSAVALPIDVDGPCVLTIYDRHTQAFNDVLVAGFTEVVSAVELGATLLRALNSVEAALEGTVRALGEMTEARDPYTQGHQLRVGRLGVAIARRLGLDSELVRLVRLSGEVHDVGKVAVPTEILNRPGRFSSLEYEMVQRHCAVGAQILSAALLPWPIAEVAAQHHERLDGSGYPVGLKGDEIILPALIIAVADVVEAMMNHRPYRPALGVEAGLEEIRSGRGVRYNADVVDACCAEFEAGFTFD